MRRLFQSCFVLLIVFSGFAVHGEDLHYRIRVAQSSGNFEEASKLYQQLLASGEDSPELRSNFAAMLQLVGHYSEAIEQARLALKSKPDLAGANLIAGLALSDLSRPKEAVTYLERAHLQDPRGVGPLLALGQCYLKLRDYVRSNDAYRQVSKLDPNNSEALFGLGITYRSLADALLKKSAPGTTPVQAKRHLESALGALTRAVELAPQSARSRLILAESYRDSGRFVDALGEYQACLRLEPGNPAAGLGLATTYWKAGEIDNAVPPLEQVLRKLPADSEANAIMADILVHKGEFDRAKPFARKALEGNPELTQTRVAMAKIYLSEDKPEPAISELKPALPRDPDGTYHYLLHRAFKMEGKEPEAAAALDEFKRLRAASRGGNKQ